MTNISKGNIPSNLNANFPEDGKYNFIRNAGAYVPDYFVSWPRRTRYFCCVPSQRRSVYVDVEAPLSNGRGISTEPRHFFRNPLQLMIHATVQKLYSLSYWQHHKTNHKTLRFCKWPTCKPSCFVCWFPYSATECSKMNTPNKLE